MLKWLEAGNQILHDFVWGPGMVAVFLFTGIYLTVKSGWFQVRGMKVWMGKTLGQFLRKKQLDKTVKNQDMSQIQSFCTALAATLGTGNITGVATALVMGGPGAIFWMWVSAFFGMMTAYGENVLGIRYRKRNKQGAWEGGAMGYMEHGLHCKWLAAIYAVCCLMVSMGMGNMAQASAMSSGLWETFGIPRSWTACILVILVTLTLSGGMSRIGTVTSYLIPFMTLFYLAGSIFVIVCNWEKLPEALGSIMSYAFKPMAAGGGIIGYTVGNAVKTGIARGIFSNEAGLGTSVMAHTASDVTEPQQQGMWAMCEVFIDTMVVCTITALVIMTSGVYEAESCLLQRVSGSEIPDGTVMAGQAFAAVIHGGDGFLSSAIALFAFATIIGWYYFGIQAVKYLFGKKGEKIYRWLYTACLIPGCVLGSGFILDLADTMNGVMAIPNLTAVMLLSGKIRWGK